MLFLKEFFGKKNIKGINKRYSALANMDNFNTTNASFRRNSLCMLVNEVPSKTREFESCGHASGLSFVCFCAYVLPAKSDSDIMFCLQSYQ